MLQGRTVLLYARATSARRLPECVKKYARVAHVILCNSVCKVRHNECTHGDEKPPPPIRDGRVYRGEEKGCGAGPGVQPLVGGEGGGVPPLAEQYFFILEPYCKFLIVRNTNLV